ncbi:MAG: hypothetical protein IJU37_08745 [Desulfovibrio sp.]|nr:hypothetical protein [Desulfovibrio sp.]
MNVPLLVALPWLHGPVSETDGPQWNALRLWPGLPDAPAKGWLCPADYPFSPNEAVACAEDLRSMGETALSGLPVEVAVTGNATAMCSASERALLEGLAAAHGNVEAARAAERSRRDELARQQAQKMLLWAWQQEERLQELAALAARFAASSKDLTAALGQADDPPLKDGVAQALTADLVRLDTPISLDASLIPSWRAIVGNALQFLPLRAVIAMEPPMLEDVVDALDFERAEQWLPFLANADQAVTLEARTPGWKVLGRTRPSGLAFLDAERVWIGWRRKA